jgi:hypothetical protein
MPYPSNGTERNQLRINFEPTTTNRITCYYFFTKGTYQHNII